MKNSYVPVKLGDRRVGTALIDADRVVITVSDKGLKNLIWDKRLLTDVSIVVPGKQDITITPNNESTGN